METTTRFNKELMEQVKAFCKKNGLVPKAVIERFVEEGLDHYKNIKKPTDFVSEIVEID